MWAAGERGQKNAVTTDCSLQGFGVDSSKVSNSATIYSLPSTCRRRQTPSQHAKRPSSVTISLDGDYPHKGLSESSQRDHIGTDHLFGWRLLEGFLKTIILLLAIPTSVSTSKPKAKYSQRRGSKYDPQSNAVAFSIIYSHFSRCRSCKSI